MNVISRRLQTVGYLLVGVGWACCIAAEPDLTLIATSVAGFTLAARWQRAAR